MSVKISLFLMLIGFAALLYVIAPAKPAPQLKPGCDFPPPGYTLIATGSADGKPTCAYHPARGWGDAK